VTQTVWNDYYHGNAPIPTPDRPIVVKAGEGAAFSDPQYQHFCAQASAQGQPAYAYYALHAGSTNEMIAQARRAAGIIGKRPAMWDVERWPAESGSAPGIASVGQTATAVDAYRAAGGVMHVIYLPRSQWAALGQPDLRPLASLGLRFINADYRPGSSTLGSPAWAPYGGITPWAVQYAACHNTSPGTRLDMMRVWEQGGTVPTPPPPVVHVVESGETMSSIAHRFGLTLAQLETLNPRAGHPAGNFDLIWPGDRLVVKR